MTREYDEKRDFIRVTVDCELTYKVPDSPTEEMGQAKNLSGRGLLFIAKRELNTDSMLEVKIKSDSDITPALHAKVKVVRVEKQRRGEGFEIGAVIREVIDEEV